MAALKDVERVLSEACWQCLTADMAVGRKECVSRAGITARILLRATTSRFRAAKYLAASDLRLFLELEAHGWMFREACSHYYPCLRNSALILESRSPVAIFPRSASDFAPRQRSVFIVFELLRRVARVRFIDHGHPPWCADSPAVTAGLIRLVAERVFGDARAAARCASLLRDAELTILESAVGWSVGTTTAPAAFLPRHLSHW